MGKSASTDSSPSTTANPGLPATVLVINTALLSLVFAGAGVVKLASVAFIGDAFIRWGYPQWFIYPVGLIELAGAAALWVPGLSFHAAAALGGIMLFAFGTHASNGQYPMAGVTLLLLVLLGFVAYGRQLMRLGAQGKRAGKRAARARTQAPASERKRDADRAPAPSADLDASLREFRKRTSGSADGGLPPPPIDGSKDGGLPPPPL